MKRYTVQTGVGPMPYETIKRTDSLEVAMTTARKELARMKQEYAETRKNAGVWITVFDADTDTYVSF